MYLKKPRWLLHPYPRQPPRPQPHLRLRLRLQTNHNRSSLLRKPAYNNWMFLSRYCAALPQYH